MCPSERYPIEISVQRMMLPPRNTYCSIACALFPPEPYTLVIGGCRTIQMQPVADIVLPMVVATINSTRLDVYFRFLLVTTAEHISSLEVITFGGLATSLRITVCLVWNCLHNREMTQ
ncbi:hypothetical protein TNCV_2001481 [Trichonephila clavipes]|nr:hypothetical protein TNCV_2001481 [Trichonephila clavipes]